MQRGGLIAKWGLGGYEIADDGVYGLVVTDYTEGLSFFLDGEEAQYFRDEWTEAKNDGYPFREFLILNDWINLF